jgi:general secretion pathway protein G
MNTFIAFSSFASRAARRRASSSPRRGFTLLELLVVILIIGLLTGIIAPRFMSQISRSETTTARAQMDAFRKAIEAFRIDNGRYPTTAEGLDVLVVAPAGATRWNGPYLQGAIPLDPWGTKYQYQSPGPNGRDYEILSYGRDRAPGGTGDDADISL